MRAGTVVNVSAADRRRLEAIVANRSAPQKHAWRAEIVLATAGGYGTAEIMRRTGKSKTVVWRWQARFCRGRRRAAARQDPQAWQTAGGDRHRAEGRRSGPWTAARGCDPLDRPDVGEAAGISLRSVQRILEADRLAPHRIRTFKLSTDPSSPRSSRISSASMSTRPPTQWCCRSTRRRRSRRSTAPSPACP